MNELIAWLTPTRRKAIYGLATAIGALLLAIGVISDAELTKITEVAGQVVLILTNLMAFSKTNTDSGTSEYTDGSKQ